MKKYLTLLLVTVLIIPTAAFASWWNPFSWKIFNKVPDAKIETPVLQPPKQVSTSTEPTGALKKKSSSSSKENIKVAPVIQKDEDTDLKIAKCQAEKDSYYNNAILKINQAIEQKLQDAYNSLNQQYNDAVSKIYSDTKIQIDRISNDPSLTGTSKVSLISEYNDENSERVKVLYDNQQTSWKNKKTEIESTKQKAIDQINSYLAEVYKGCLVK